MVLHALFYSHVVACSLLVSGTALIAPSCVCNLLAYLRGQRRVNQATGAETDQVPPRPMRAADGATSTDNGLTCASRAANAVRCRMRCYGLGADFDLEFSDDSLRSFIGAMHMPHAATGHTKTSQETDLDDVASVGPSIIEDGGCGGDDGPNVFFDQLSNEDTIEGSADEHPCQTQRTRPADEREMTIRAVGKLWDAWVPVITFCLDDDNDSDDSDSSTDSTKKDLVGQWLLDDALPAVNYLTRHRDASPVFGGRVEKALCARTTVNHRGDPRNGY